MYFIRHFYFTTYLKFCKFFNSVNSDSDYFELKISLYCKLILPKLINSPVDKL
jgi:hypothetical protein